MTLFDDLSAKLDGAKADLDHLVIEFQKVVALRDSLESTDTSLRAAADNVTKLATALEGSTAQLAECLSAVRSAVAIFDSINISEIKWSENALGQRITLVKRAVDDLERTSRGSATREWILLVLVLAVLGLSSISAYLTYGSLFLGS